MTNDNNRQLTRFNQAKYLFLRSLNETGFNRLELVAQEAIANEAKRGDLTTSRLPDSLSFLLQDAVAIESVPGSCSFRFFWKRYTAYLVTEECVAGGGNFDDESYEGDRVRIYSNSHFIEHLARDTGGHAGPLIHYKIICQNQVIDIVAEDHPEIAIIESSSRSYAQ